jgi:CHAT domain-containing protein
MLCKVKISNTDSPYIIIFLLALFSVFNNSLFSQGTQDANRCRTLILEASRLEAQNDHDNAFRLYKEALPIAEAIKDKECMIICNFSLGKISKNKGNYDDARNYLSQALSYFGDTETREIEKYRVLVVSELGFFYLNCVVNHNLALKYLNEARDIFNKAGDIEGEISALLLIGGVNINQFNYREAIISLDRAINLARSSNDKKKESTASYLLYGLYKSIDNPDKAVIYLHRVLELASEENNKDEMTDYLIAAGDMQLITGNNVVARSFFGRALNLSSEKNDLDQQSRIIARIAQTLQNEKKYEESIKAFMNALDYANKGGRLFQQEYVLSKLGYLWLIQKDWAKCISFAEKALEIATKTGNKDGIAQDSLFLGIANLRIGKEDIGLRYLYSCQEIFESARVNIQNREDKATYADERILPYEYIIEILHKQASGRSKQKKTEEAFALSEKARARIFLDMLMEAQSGPGNLVNSKDLDYENFLYSEIGRLRAAMLVKGQNNKDETNKLLALYNQYEIKLDEHKAKLLEKNPKYVNARYPRTLSIENVQKEILVKKDEAILEYYIGEENSFLFVITPRMYEFIKIDENKDRLVKQVQQLRSYYNEATDILSVLRSSDRPDITTARHLYKMLIQPARRYLNKIKKITIIPHGCLNYLPFELLVSEYQVKPIENSKQQKTTNTVRYLIEDYSINYVPSLSFIDISSQLHKDKREQRDSLLAFGDLVYTSSNGPINNGQSETDVPLRRLKNGLSSLPYSAKEIEEIAPLFQNPKIYTNREATKQNFIEQSSYYKYIHLSTHGYSDEDNPLYSGIIFAYRNDNKDVDILYTHEVFNLDLACETLIMSACETGLGQKLGLLNGEGVSGLQRAFLFAGAKSLIVSLWSVEDESTSILMKEFYRYYIQDRMNKSDALRAAKLSLMKMGKKIGNLVLSYSHPFFWAPFVLIGDPK